MKKTSILFFLSIIFQFQFSNISSAQTERVVVTHEKHELNLARVNLGENITQFRASTLKDVPFQNPEPFVAYSIVWESEEWSANSTLSITFWDGEKWNQQPVEIDSHSKQEKNKFISQLYFLENKATKFRLDYSADTELEGIEVHFFNPGKSTPNPVPYQPLGLTNRNACPCPQPEYLDRVGWCPDGDCPEDATPVPTNVTHLIVHHSAGSNSSSDWAATVRSIWDFHVNVNGWDDIGYNWLVDPNGVIYEGRGDNRLGAHFCGTNGSTAGICVLGDFTAITPTPDAYASLEDLLSWKSCDINADPLGTSSHSSSGLDLMHISGHRDGCATSCPGDSFYPTFGDIRMGVAQAIATECNDINIAAPTELDAEANGFTSIELNWLDNSENETGFTIERSESFNTNFEEIATVPENTIAYTDTDVQASTGYFYRIKADTSDFSSLYSNEAFAATAFSAVDDNQLDGGSLQIFPNPATEKITLSIENQWMGNFSTTIMDALGRQVLPAFTSQKSNTKVQLEIDLSELASGIYWVKVSQENGAIGTQRLMKKR